MVATMVLWVAANGAVSWAQPVAETVSAGYDLFTTDPTETDLLGILFEGDAGVRPTFDFVPPPSSADGRRAIADTDTIVHRLEDASVATVPGTADPITIEVVLLRLVSTITFDLDVDGDGVRSEPIYVTLQKDRNPAGETRLDFDVPPPAEGDPPPPGPIEEDVLPGPRSFGEMTITFSSAEGGAFDSHLDIFADLRFGSPTGPIVCGETAGLPPCADLDAGLVLESIDSAWGRDALPESITIRGVNFSLAAPDRNQPIDTSTDFWAGVDPMMKRTVCVRHGGHPDPGGAPTQHNTCRTLCTTEAIAASSCRNGRDDNCNGLIDDCGEDLFGPTVTAPDDRTYECALTDPDTSTAANGFATATDNCFPPVLPDSSIGHRDFETEGCGRTFLIDRIWTATDDCGNSASMPDLQQIEVVDTTPPEITCPEDQTILWTSDRSIDSLGNGEGYDVCNAPPDDVAVGFGDVSVPGVCRSEEIARTFTATDACGLQTPCTQRISVRGPRDAIDDLAGLLSGLGLPQGIDNALSSTLQNGVDSVCANNSTPAVNQIEAFINQVEAQTPARISQADADRLIDAAAAIIAAIEDPVNGGACPEGCGDTGGGGGGGGGGDACPDSDTSPTVVIDGCDSGVDNYPLGDGCTVSDRIGDCAEAAVNHGEFVRCVNDIGDDLVDAGLVSGRDRGAIQRCAAGADLP